jgi:hypothetical protein
MGVGRYCTHTAHTAMQSRSDTAEMLARNGKGKLCMSDPAASVCYDVKPLYPMRFVRFG